MTHEKAPLLNQPAISRPFESEHLLPPCPREPGRCLLEHGGDGLTPSAPCTSPPYLKPLLRGARVSFSYLSRRLEVSSGDGVSLPSLYHPRAMARHPRSGPDPTPSFQRKAVVNRLPTKELGTSNRERSLLGKVCGENRTATRRRMNPTAVFYHVGKATQTGFGA